MSTNSINKCMQGSCFQSHYLPAYPGMSEYCWCSYSELENIPPNIHRLINNYIILKKALILNFNSPAQAGSHSFEERNLLERCLWLSFKRSLMPINFVYMCTSLEKIQPLPEIFRSIHESTCSKPLYESNG